MNNQAKPCRVLAVDDEPINLSILEHELLDQGYEVIATTDSEEGWRILKEQADSINVVLLDRMMPKLDGISFMKRVMEDEVVRDIPVIMQTAAAQDEQIIQGIEAGVYYYLTKPFTPEVLVSIVKAALRDTLQRRDIRRQPKEFVNKIHRLREAVFEIQTMGEVRYLSTFLSQFYPEPETVVLGLHELMVNAIEHGNLGIGFDLKTQLLQDDNWCEEIDMRIAAPENAEKYVTVSYKHSDEAIEVTIVDVGAGFNWQQYLEFSPERMMDSHGRGVAIANKMSFDDLQYNDAGNQVYTKVKLALPEEVREAS